MGLLDMIVGQAFSIPIYNKKLQHKVKKIVYF